jgi:hypothetical protein
MAGCGPLPGGDVIIEPGTAMKGLMTGGINPALALETGEVRVIAGDPALVFRFAELFHVPGVIAATVN